MGGARQHQKTQQRVPSTVACMPGHIRVRQRLGGNRWSRLEEAKRGHMQATPARLRRTANQWQRRRCQRTNSGEEGGGRREAERQDLRRPRPPEWKPQEEQRHGKKERRRTGGQQEWPHLEHL